MTTMKEVKKVSGVAGPMVAVMVIQSLSQVVSLMMVGHLDALSLAGASIATSFTNVTGFAFLLGMACALETLCGQAYGAEQYEKLGIYTYGGITCLIVLCFPICLIWTFTDKILMLVGQDREISIAARNFSVCLIPKLFAYAVLQPLIRFFQTQSLVLPLLVSSFATLCFQVPLSWVMVFKFELKSMGAALALGISFWFYVFLLSFYIIFSSKCQKTRGATFSRDFLQRIWEFFRLAVPSAAMVCLEWWSSEVLILLSGILPNPRIETSVLSICFTITYIHYFVPYGFGATVSTRVSNELGAGNPKAAKIAVVAILVLAVTEVVIVAAVLFFFRHILGYVFSNEKDIVNHVSDLGPFMCLLMTVDCLQAVFSGVARGSGWQKIGAYVNLGAFYLVGIPLGAVLAFVLHLKAKGLMIGFIMGTFVQATLLVLTTLFTDWQKQASKARERMFQSNDVVV